MFARQNTRTLAGRLVAAVAGFLGMLAFEPPRSSADEISWMFNPDAVVEMNIGDISEAELDALEAEPDEYVKGTFELKVDGVTKGVPLADVGVRRKGGFGSSRPIKTGKSGLKIRFDEFVDDQLFFGIKRLTLNNMFQDESMLHETLTYELFHELGLPASRTGYAFVNLNGEKYGLFLNIETLDEVSLPQWFPTFGEPGHLYEADLSGTDVRPGEAGTFEVDEGDDEDLSDLEALIAAANDEEGDWSDGMAPVADLEAMTAQWAVERYVGHWDGYAGAPESSPGPEGPIRPNNYYLHSNEAKIFQMMPWGTDQTWEFPRGFGASAGGLMFNECLADESCRQLYVEGLTDIHCLNETSFNQRIHAAQLAAMLAPFQEEEDPLRRGYTDEEIKDEVESTMDFAVLRAGLLEEYLIDEGVLGAGIDPCGAPPQPEQPDEKSPAVGGGQDPTPIAAPAGELRIGPPRVRGDFIVTRIQAPSAGTATEQVSARLAGRRVKVCSAQAVAVGRGSLTLRCRLSTRAREELAEAPLRLRVRVGFHPAGAAASWFSSNLILPRRS